MSLQFILGRSGSGKSTYCIEMASRAEETGKRVIMIVPEQYSHQGESAFLEKKGFIYDDFNVTSFGRLASKIITNSGIMRKTIDSAGKAMLMQKAVNNCRKSLHFFASATESRGYIKLFSDAISEFKKGQVTPEDLRNAAQNTSERLFSVRLTDFAKIYQEYNRLLSDNAADSDDDLTLASTLCQSSDYIKNAEIYIDAFYRFTQNELSMIASFLAAGANVYVSLCMPEFFSASSVFQSVAGTKNTLEQLAKRENVAILSPVVTEKSVRYLSQELSHLEGGLANKINPWDAHCAHISLSVFRDKYDEVMHTAANIRKLIADTGASFRDIAVIAGDYDGYADLVQSIFPMYDIPVFIDTRQDFLNHPLVLYLFSVMDLLSGITTKRVVSYMKSGFADISEESTFRLENYALSTAIEYGDWLNDARFSYKINSFFDTEEQNQLINEELLREKNRMLAPILLLKEKIMESKTVFHRIQALESFLEATNLREKIDQRITEYRASQQNRFADEFAEVYNILMETLATMATTLGDETIGIAGMRAILEAGLSEKSIGVIPVVYDQVSYGDLNRSVIKNVRTLFVLGANDGSFPSIPTDSAFLSDDEREFLLSQGVCVAPDTKRRITDGEFSVYNAVTISRERLFVSYAVSNDKGESLRPAMFISKLRRMFPKLIARNYLAEIAESSVEFIASKQSAYNFVLTHINEKDKNETVAKLYDILQKDEEYKKRLSRAEQYAQYENTAGRLSSETVANLYGSRLYGSVSRFERFSSCPFSFFIEYGLKARERKVLKVEAPDIGSLLHEIIERFSLEMTLQKKSFGTIAEEEQRQITDAIIEEMFSAMVVKNIYSTNRLLALKKRLKHLVSTSVWAICRHVAMGQFEPTAFEVAFDTDGTFAPVTIPLPTGGEITMRGRIDRIDTFRDKGNLYIKIIDYKSGSKGYSLSDIFNGTTLQLAVYMVAAVEGMAKTQSENAQFGGMFYFHLDDPVSSGIPGDDTDREDVLKSFKMSGLSSDNPNVLRAIDANANGWSAVIPVYFKTDGSVSTKQSKTATVHQFETLKRYIKNTLSKIGQEIMRGTVDIKPAKSASFMPCTYCKYLSVCGYDAGVHPCRRVDNSCPDDILWGKIEEEVQEQNNTY